MDEYKIIMEARSLTEAFPRRELSDCTKEGYSATSKRLMKLTSGMQGLRIEHLIKFAKDTTSITTWFSRRASMIFYCIVGIESFLQQQDEIQRALKAAQMDPDVQQWEEWKKMVRTIGLLSSWHTRFRSEPAIGERKPRHSKRMDMKDLPDDWRERIIRRLPKYRPAALTEAVTGCRPDELTKGVKLSIVGDKLIAEIEGSKVTTTSGQPWRRLSWPVDSESPLVAMLVDEVRNGLSIARIENAKAYSGAVRAAGKREWPDRKKNLTPYCFRHAAASDMKAAGTDDLKISAALGHCVDKAKSSYGQWKQGRRSGGVSPIKIEATRLVRISKPRPSQYLPGHEPSESPKP